MKSRQQAFLQKVVLTVSQDNKAVALERVGRSCRLPNDADLGGIAIYALASTALALLCAAISCSASRFPLATRALLMPVHLNRHVQAATYVTGTLADKCDMDHAAHAGMCLANDGLQVCIMHICSPRFGIGISLCIVQIYWWLCSWPARLLPESCCAGCSKPVVSIVDRRALSISHMPMAW